VKASNGLLNQFVIS